MSLPPLPCQAVAVYSWSGEQDSDLGMIEGDKIEVFDYGDGNWWFGRLQRNKMQGVFPKNYVKVLEIPRSDSRHSLQSSPRPRLTQSPSYASDRLPNSMSYQQLAHANSQQHLAHANSQQHLAHSNSQQHLAHSNSQHLSSSKSQQFYQHHEHNSFDNVQDPRFSYQSSRKFSTRPQLKKFYSTNDLSRYTNGGSPSPVRDDIDSEVDYVSDEDNDSYDDDEGPPPPPPKNSKDSFKRHSLFSSPAASDKRSSPLSSAQGTPQHTAKNIADFSMLKNSMQRGGLDVSGYSYQQLYDSLMSTDTERSVQFGHSNFSATSAGSMARHNYQHEIEERNAKIKEVQLQGGLQTFNEKEQAEILKKIFVDKKQSRHPKLLKKLFSKESKVSLDDQIYGLSLNDSTVSFDTGSSDVTQEDIVENDADLQKIDSILSEVTMPSIERAKREERAMQDSPYSILKPFNGINEKLNFNEIVSKASLNIDSIPLYHVDKFIRKTPIDKYESIESIARNIIGANFQSDLEKIRAIYCFCTDKIDLVPVIHEPMDRRVSPKMTDIVFSKQATPYQLTWLFKLMANCLQIKTDIVLGHFKHPFKDINEVATTDKLVPNHSWISILIEGRWRMVDVVLGNLSNEEIYQNYNFNESNSELHHSFYFLSKPLELISTHIPIIVEQQHILPPIDTMIALLLPPLYPSYYHYGLRFYKFNSALSRLRDTDIGEFQIQVPADVEIIARVQSCDEVNVQGHNEQKGEEQTSLQAMWYKNRKIFVIRAILPPRTSMGFLKIYVGDKSTNTNEYLLASTIQLYHQGVYKLLSFVKRYPTKHTLKQDLLVQKPQCYNLKLNEPVEFLIKQHPSFQIDSFNKHEAVTKISLQSPSGKITKLNRVDDTKKIYGDWGALLPLNEPGLWRGLVLTDDGLRWSVFCEWNCQ